MSLDTETMTTLRLLLSACAIPALRAWPVPACSPTGEASERARKTRVGHVQVGPGVCWCGLNYPALYHFAGGGNNVKRAGVERRGQRRRGRGRTLRQGDPPRRTLQRADRLRDSGHHLRREPGVLPARVGHDQP